MGIKTKVKPSDALVTKWGKAAKEAMEQRAAQIFNSSYLTDTTAWYLTESKAITASEITARSRYHIKQWRDYKMGTLADDEIKDETPALDAIVSGVIAKLEV